MGEASNYVSGRVRWGNTDRRVTPNKCSHTKTNSYFAPPLSMNAALPSVNQLPPTVCRGRRAFVYEVKNLIFRMPDVAFRAFNIVSHVGRDCVILLR